MVGHYNAHAFLAEEEPPSSENDNNKTDGSSQTLQRSDIKIPQPISPFIQQKQDLTHYLSDKNTQVVKVDQNEYIIIEETSTTSNNKGVAILIPDWQQGLTNPKAMNFLQASLPSLGWSTISVQSPNKPNAYPSNASTIKESAKQNKMALEFYKAEVEGLLMEVMKKARNYPGIFLVITQGSQAAILVDIYKDKQELSPAALVTLSAGMYSTIENKAFAYNIATSSLPVLDLILQKDSNNVIENAALRKKYAAKEFKTLYRQKQLTNMMPGYYPEHTLLQEINGWLKSIGW